MASFQPQHVIVCDDATDLAATKAYLDDLGYGVGVNVGAVRTDDDEALTITVVYPTWVR